MLGPHQLGARRRQEVDVPLMEASETPKQWCSLLVCDGTNTSLGVGKLRSGLPKTQKVFISNYRNLLILSKKHVNLQVHPMQSKSIALGKISNKR